MAIRDLLTELSRRLRDVERRQWDEQVLTNALNAAFGALVNAAPASRTVERTIELVDGANQRLPADLHRLVRVLHNVGADGSVGRPVTRVDPAVMDMAAPGWRTDPVRDHIRHWMQSDIEERRFDVWPQANGSDPVIPPMPQAPVAPAPGGSLKLYSTELLEYTEGLQARLDLVDGSVVYQDDFDADPPDELIPGSGVYQLAIELRGNAFDDGGIDKPINYDPALYGPGGGPPGSQSAIFLDIRGPNNTTLRGNDPRLVAGNYLKGRLEGNTFRVENDADFDYTPGVQPLIAPVPPVDPGPLGSGGSPEAPDGAYDLEFGSSSNTGIIFLRARGYPVPGFNTQLVDVVLPTDTQYPQPYYPVLVSTDSTTTPANVNVVAVALNENGNGLFYGDASMTPGHVLRVQFNGASSATLVGVDLYSEGVTQADIDAYQATLAQYQTDLAAYNAALAAEAEVQAQYRRELLAYQAALAAPPRSRVHVIATEVPVIEEGTASLCGPEVIVPPRPIDPGSSATQAELDYYTAAIAAYYQALHAKWLRDAACDGTLPAVPQAPVDPGPVGTGATPYRLFDGTVANVSSFAGLLIERLDGGGQDDPFNVYAHEGESILLRIKANTATSNRQVSRSPDRIFALGAPVTAPNWALVSLVFDNGNAARNASDPVFTPGRYWQVNVAPQSDVNGAVIYNVVATDAPAFDPGTSQEEVDAYQTDLAQYDADLAAYEAALAAVPTAASDVLTLDSALPVDRFYRAPLLEYALYYCYSVDDDMTANAGRANQHLNNFYQFVNKVDDTAVTVTGESLGAER